MPDRIKGITVEIGGDVTGLNKALKDVNSNINSTQSALKDVDRLLKLDPTNTTLLAQKQQLLAKAIEETSKKLETLKEAERQAQEQFQRGEISLEQYQGLQREIVATEQKLKSLKDQVPSLADKLKNGLATAAKVGAEAVKLVAEALAAATAAATAAAVAFAKSSVEVGMEFDAAMSQVAATMGTTVGKIQNLRDFALEMGSTTAFSATEAAEALNYMALAGYNAETSMAMLPNVLNLAAAGSIDLASASDMITDAQSALGLTLEETSAMVDQMAKASSKSNTSVAQLGEAILTVGGTASYMAGGTEELNTVLGVLADNGIKGSEAGTHLRNMLLSLSSPTKDANALLTQLNVGIFDAEGNMRSFADIFPELNAAMSDMTDQEKLDAFSTLFNSRDIASATALLSTTTERWEELGGAILDSAGAAQQMADTQLDNLAGDITMFKSALEGAQIVLSDQLTPNLREFVQFGTDAISTLSEAFKEGGLTDAMEALGAILSEGLDMVIEQLPAMVDAGMQLLGALGQGLLDNLPMITDAAIEIVLMLADGFLVALPAIFAGAAQIIAELASGIGEAAPELVPKAVEAVLRFIEGLTNPESLNNLIDGALQLIEGLGEGIIKSLPLLIEYGPEIVVNLVAGIISALPQLLEGGVQLVQGLVEGLIQGVAAIPAAIARVVSAVVDGFKALFGIHSPSTVMAEMGVNLINGLLQGISGTWNTIVEFFSGAAESLISFLEKTWNSVKEAAGTAWDAIKETVSGAWNAIVGVWDAAAGFFGGIWSRIQAAAGAAASAIGSVLSGAWSAITSAWSGAAGFFSGIWSGITGVFSNAFSLFSGIGMNIVDGIRSGISAAWTNLTNWVSGLFGNLVSSVKNLLGIASPSKVFAGIGGNMALGLEAGWDDEFKAIKSKIENGLDFGAIAVGVNANTTYKAGESAQEGQQAGFGGMGDTYVTINSPVAVDAVTAAREWRKTTQRMAMSYV